MSKKYDLIMDHVYVTDGMRGRILQHFRSADIPPKAKTVRLRRRQKYAAVAACIAVMLIGALAVSGILQKSPELPPVNAEDGRNIVEYPSADELSRQLGFPIADVVSLPFEVTDTVYLSLWGETGEIDCTGANGQTAAYRKSIGTDDNSGVYETFSDTQQISAGTVSATIRGSGTQYTLAFWTDGTYAHSLVLSEGVSLVEWREIILSNS